MLITGIHAAQRIQSKFKALGHPKFKRDSEGIHCGRELLLIQLPTADTEYCSPATFHSPFVSLDDHSKYVRVVRQPLSVGGINPSALGIQRSVVLTWINVSDKFE